MPFATTWMDLEGITFSELSQTEKDKYCYVFTYMWKLKNKMNEYNKTENRLTDTENKLVVTSGERGGHRTNTGEGY